MPDFQIKKNNVYDSSLQIRKMVHVKDLNLLEIIK